MSDSSQEMTVQGTGWHGMRERDPNEVQLAGELLVDQADVRPRVDERGEGVGPPWQQKLDVEQRSWAGGRVLGTAQQNAPLNC